jgi:hypothetical protein
VPVDMKNVRKVERVPLKGDLLSSHRLGFASRACDTPIDV